MEMGKTKEEYSSLCFETGKRKNARSDWRSNTRPPAQ